MRVPRMLPALTCWIALCAFAPQGAHALGLGRASHHSRVIRKKHPIPRTPTPIPSIPLLEGPPEPIPGTREIWIAPVGASGSAGSGTYQDPYIASSSTGFDELMMSLSRPESSRYAGTALPVIIHLKAGTYQTRGNAEWSHDNWLLQDNWTLQGAGRDSTVIQMDPYAVQSFPILMPSNGQYFFQEELSLILGKAVQGRIPKRQKIRDLTLDGRFSRMVREGFFNGKPLRLGGAHLYGEGSSIENVRFTDYGSTRGAQETFVALIEGARNNSLPSGTSLDSGCLGTSCAHISDSLFDGLVDPVARDSGQQITVFSIFGTFNGASGGFSDPNREDIFLISSYLSRNTVSVDDSNQIYPGGDGNLVQGFAMINVAGGVVSDNFTRNARMGYYSDTLRLRDMLITRNHFERAMIGVAFFTDQSPDFGYDGVTISDNTITTMPFNDGARCAIFLTRSVPSIENERWEFYPGSAHPRHLRSFLLTGNTIGLAVPPKGPYANVAIMAHEVEGLTISNTRIDWNFMTDMELSPVVRRDSAGNAIASYANSGLYVSGTTHY
jgi:hypothetical protein